MKRIASSAVVRSFLSLAAAAALLAVSTTALAAEGEETTTESAPAPTATVTEDVAAPVAKDAPAAAIKSSKDEAAPEAPAVVTDEVQPATQPAAPAFTMTAPQMFAAEKSSSTNDRDAFHFGPLAGIGFPHPIAVEAFAKVKNLVGFGAEYSFLPTMTIAGADTSFKAVAIDARLFPFKNAFFVGFRGGRQWLEARTTVSAGALGSSEETMQASTWFVNPRVGFLHSFKSGVTVGMDAGVQIPVSPSFARTGRAEAAGVSGDTDRQLAQVANVLGNKATPTIDLLRVGYMF